MSRWLWHLDDIQQDICLLQEKYKSLGYVLSKEQVYDVWHLYSEFCHANWLKVDNDISKSEWCINKVLNR